MVFSNSDDQQIQCQHQIFFKFGPAENRYRFIKIKDSPNFDEFLSEVGVAQMGIFSNQTKYYAIYQLYSTSSFFLTTLF